MTTCVVAFGLAFAVSVLATLLVRAAALRLGVVDRPDEFRKLHGREVPLLGGIAVLLGFAAPIAAILFLYHNAVSEALLHHAVQLRALLAGAGIVLALGVVDDVRGLPARWKLLGQSAAAAVAMAGGYVISTVSNPFGSPFELGALSLPVTLLWFLGCINAVNLLDGLDGLAAGISLLASVTLLLVSLAFGEVQTTFLMVCLSAALLGFLLFNFHPASVFLGDCGSMGLGFLLAALSLHSARKAETAVVLIIPLAVLGLPLFDTSLAIVRRWLHRLPIASGDRQHLHHVLLAMGLTHRQVVLVLYVAGAVLGVAGVLMATGRDELTLLIMASLMAAGLVGARVFGGLRPADLWGRVSDGWHRHRRSTEAKMAVERALARMRTARQLETLWAASCAGLQALGFDFAVLQLLGRADARRLVLVWPPEKDPVAELARNGHESWRARLRLQSNGHALGEVEMSKCVEHDPMLPEAPELVERLRTEMASQLERVLNPAELAEPVATVLSAEGLAAVGPVRLRDAG